MSDLVYRKENSAHDLNLYAVFQLACRIFAIIGPLCVKWIFISGNDDDVSCGNIILSTTGDLKMEVQLD